MDFRRFFFNRPFFKNLKQKLSWNSRRGGGTQPTPSQIKLLNGAGISLVALILAWLTQTSIREQSVYEHLNATWPSRETWIGSLQEMGYTRITDANLQSRLLRTLTPEFHSTGAIWSPLQSGILYLYDSPMNPGRPELWSCTAKPEVPRQWIKLGSGLYAFQQIKNCGPKPMKLSKKISNPIDPMEIRY